MFIEGVAAKRSRPHTRYKLADGTPCGGVTTILGVLNKPALGPWHNRMGLNGVDTSRYVDTLALVGTCAHDMVSCHIQNKKFEPDNIPADLIDAAENSFLKYLEWEKGHTVEPILCEAPLVSEKYRYGGQIDFYGKVDGLLALVDFKTAKNIWPEMLYQVAAYKNLLLETGRKVESVGILQIGRNADEGFSERTITNTDREWAIFEHCLALYKLGVGK